jgi:SH3-like domain-containing protein
MRYILVFLILVSPLANATANAKVPYFASIKAGEANVRTGPSVRYPIKWVYQRPSWPVEITATFEGWRKIRDIKGEAGWIHESLLTGKRNTVINTKGVQEIYKLPIANSKVVAIAENGVIAKLDECKKQWCKINASNKKGWIESKYLWGVKKNEVFD